MMFATAFIVRKWGFVGLTVVTLKDFQIMLQFMEIKTILLGAHFCLTRVQISPLIEKVGGKKGLDRHVDRVEVDRLPIFCQSFAWTILLDIACWGVLVLLIFCKILVSTRFCGVCVPCGSCAPVLELGVQKLFLSSRPLPVRRSAVAF